MHSKSHKSTWSDDKPQQSTAPMMHIEANVASSDISVDKHGNLVIKNKELAEMVADYLSSPQGAAMQRQAAHLLCCKLSCPMCHEQ